MSEPMLASIRVIIAAYAFCSSVPAWRRKCPNRRRAGDRVDVKVRNRVVHLHVKRRAVAGMVGDVLFGLGREQIVRVLGRATRSAVIGDGRNALRGLASLCHIQS